MKRKKAVVMPASSNAVGAISRLLSTLRSPSKGGEEVHPSVHVHVVPPVEHATAELGTGSVRAPIGVCGETEKGLLNFRRR